jgi:hypothetical protein
MRMLIPLGPLGYVENTLRNASETEAAVTVFKSCF